MEEEAVVSVVLVDVNFNVDDIVVFGLPLTVFFFLTFLNLKTFFIDFFLFFFLFLLLLQFLDLFGVFIFLPLNFLRFEFLDFCVVFIFLALSFDRTLNLLDFFVFFNFFPSSFVLLF